MLFLYDLDYFSSDDFLISCDFFGFGSSLKHSLIDMI